MDVKVQNVNTKIVLLKFVQISVESLQGRLDNLKQLLYDVMEQICDNVDTALISSPEGSKLNQVRPLMSLRSVSYHSGLLPRLL